MPTYAVDVRDRVAQRVVPTYATENRADTRFRVVTADTGREALEQASREAHALLKREKILAGEEVIMSDKELDFLAEADLHPKNAVSVPNPAQCGLLDRYIVGLASCPTIAALRAAAGLTRV